VVVEEQPLPAFFVLLAGFGPSVQTEHSEVPQQAGFEFILSLSIGLVLNLSKDPAPTMRNYTSIYNNILVSNEHTSNIWGGAAFEQRSPFYLYF
jgi:hypothetical protein